MKTFAFIRQFAIQGLLLLVICNLASAHDENRYHGWIGETTYGGGIFPGGDTIRVPGSPLEVTITFSPDRIHFDPQHEFTVTVVVKNTNMPNPADPDDPVNDPVPVPSRSVGELSFATSVSSNVSGASQLDPQESLTDTFQFMSAFDNGCGEDATAVLNYAEIAGDTIGVRFVCDEDFDPLRAVPPPTCDSQGSDAPGTKPSPPQPTLNMGGGDASAGGASNECCETAAFMRGAPANTSVAGNFLGSSFLHAGVAWQGAGSSGSQMHLLRGIRFLPQRNTFSSSLGLGLFLPYDKTVQMFQDGSSYELQVFDPVLGFPVAGSFSTFANEFRWDQAVYADVEIVDPAGDPTDLVVEAAEITLFRHDGSRLKFESPLQNGQFRYAGTMNENDLPVLTVSYEDDFASKITTVKDEYDGQVNFGYDGTMAGGQEAITSITFPGEPALPVVYDGEVATEINLPENTKIEFEVEVPAGAVNGTIHVTIKSPFEGDKKYELSSDYRILSPNYVIVQPVGYIRKVFDAEGELEWAIFFSPIESGLVRVLEEGGRKLTEYVYGKSRTSYKAFTVGDLKLGFSAFTDLVPDTVDTVGGMFGAPLFNTPSSATDANGESFSYQYDDDDFIIRKDYIDDGTFEEWEYDDLKNITRYRNRLGNITKFVFDAAGNMLEQQEGIKDVGGVDTQMPEFAVFKFEYFPDGMLKTEFLPQWNGEADLFRTDYVYTSFGSLHKKIESADFAGEVRPETTYTYNAARLLHTVTDQVGRMVTFEYDDLNRQIRKIYNDGSESKTIYGPTPSGNRVIFEINRVGVAKSYEYDVQGRITRMIDGFGIDNGAGGVIPNPKPWDRSISEMEYLPGTNLLASQTVDGKKTEFVYDHKLRTIETRRFPKKGQVLTEKIHYVGDRIFCMEDAYGRKAYQVFSAANPSDPIRTVTGNIPEFSLANFDAVLNLLRDDSDNAAFSIDDVIRDSLGNVLEKIDGRGLVTKREYDSRNFVVREIMAFGTSLESVTETDYLVDGHLKEIRTPRYFNAADQRGFELAKSTFTYTGRQLEATSSQILSSSQTASRSKTYYPDGKTNTETDPLGYVSTSFWHQCCGRFLGMRNAEGHGEFSNTDAEGRITHTAVVRNYDTHGNSHNPQNGTTLNETTMSYDSLGRRFATSKWLSTLGEIDPDNVPIAGLDGTSADKGLTQLLLYDNDLSDGIGMDTSEGIDVELPGGETYGLSLAPCLNQLKKGRSDGGAATRFVAGESSGSALVTVNSENEVEVLIKDGTGRLVMEAIVEGIGQPNPNALVTWTCIAHDYLVGTSPAGGKCLETRTIDPHGNLERIRTDGSGRVVMTLDGLNHSTVNFYDPNNNVTATYDQNRVGHRSLYDSLNREYLRIDTWKNLTRFFYDLAGNTTSVVDAKGKRIVQIFDAGNRRVAYRDANYEFTRFTYDNRNQIKTIRDAENRISSYQYDSVGDLLREKLPDHSSGSSWGDDGYGIVSFSYDAARRIRRRTDQQGQSVRYVYDRANRKLKEEFRTVENYPVGPVTDSNVFEYDRMGRLISATSERYANEVKMTWLNGKIASESLVTDGIEYGFSYQYDDSHRLEQVAYPDGRVLERSYTERDRVETTTFDSQLVETRIYDKSGRLSQTQFGNGVINSLTYRKSGAQGDNVLASIAFEHPAGVSDELKIGSFDYTYDKNRNKLTETISGPSNPMTGFGSASFGYDNEDRLTSWSRSDGNLNRSWNLSPVGDWNSLDTNGSLATRTHSLTHEIMDNDGATVLHDPQGNMIDDGSGKVFSWDFEYHLTQATKNLVGGGVETTTFAYDALGRRVKKNDKVFAHSGGQILAEYDVGSQPSAPSDVVVFGTFIDEPILKKGTGGDVYYSRNSQLSVIALTDSAGTVVERYAYSPYGEQTILDGQGNAVAESAFGNRYSFTGREFDSETGLYYFRSRYFSSNLGRFISRDPLGYTDGLSTYRGYFVPGTVDPLGLKKWKTKVVGKSFIADIDKVGGVGTDPTDIFNQSGNLGSAIGGQYVPGTDINIRIPYPSDFLRGQASYWAFNLKENPQTDQMASVEWDIKMGNDFPYPVRTPKNFDYRLFSELNLTFDCCDGKLTMDPSKPRVKIDGGHEALGVIYGTIDLDNFKFRKLNESSMRWEYRVFGRPNMLAEPGFQVVKSRTSKFIWHKVEVVISCKGDKGSHKTKFSAVSGFPSHRLWANGNLEDERNQGSLDRLWKPDPSDPTFVAPAP